MVPDVSHVRPETIFANIMQPRHHRINPSTRPHSASAPPPIQISAQTTEAMKAYEDSDEEAEPDEFSTEIEEDNYEHVSTVS